MLLEYIVSKVIKKLRLRAIKNTILPKQSKICSGTSVVDCSFGKYSDVGYDCVIVRTKLGSFVSIGSGCRIGGASHPMDWVSTSPVFSAHPDHLRKKFAHHKFDPYIETEIGNDVWIGDGVFIKAGVKVGNGCVIGMGSVVTKNVPDYEIWAGNPAKKIKDRFPAEISKKLLKICWWNWEDDAIEKAAELFNSVSDFVARYY